MQNAKIIDSQKNFPAKELKYSINLLFRFNFKPDLLGDVSYIIHRNVHILRLETHVTLSQLTTCQIVRWTESSRTTILSP